MPRKMKPKAQNASEIKDTELQNDTPKTGQELQISEPQQVKVTPKLRYTENPFLDQMIVVTKKKRLTVARGSRIVDLDTGEIEGKTEIVQVVDVDKEQFVKLFIKDLAVWFDLSRAGQKALAYVLKAIGTKSIMKDTVMLDFTSDIEAEFAMSRTVFFRGLTELIERQVVAKHKLQGLYFINPALVFNGDRARFVREYRVRKQTPPDVQKRQELEAKGQQRLID